MNALPRSLSVRAVTPADVDAVCSFLYRKADGRIAPKEWRALFEYGWNHDDRERGFVLVKAEEIVGFIGTVRSTRKVNNKMERISNWSTWFVLPEYRRGSLLLIMAATNRQDETVTGLTPTREAQRIYERFGFGALDSEKVALLPLLNVSGLASRTFARVISDREQIRRLLGAADRQILDDHAPYACGHFAIKSTDSHAYVVTKRRTKHHIPFSEILYCSNVDLFVTHLERLKLVILTQQRSLALMVDRRLLRGHRPLGIRIHRPSIFRSKTLTADEIDNLYSELVLLPT